MCYSYFESPSLNLRLADTYNTEDCKLFLSVYHEELLIAQKAYLQYAHQVILHTNLTQDLQWQ